MSKFEKAKVDPKAQKGDIKMGTRSSVLGTKRTPIQPKGSMTDPKAPSKFPSPKSSPSKPKTDMGTSPVTRKNLTNMNLGPKDHLKAGTDSVVTTKEALLWQKGMGPIRTIKSNVTALVTGQVNTANNNKDKITPKQRGKLAVTGALNMVPGIGSVTNFANGVVSSVQKKNKSMQTEFNKGNVVFKTPVKSVPTDGGSVQNAQANSTKSVKLTNSPFGNLKKNN